MSSAYRDDKLAKFQQSIQQRQQTPSPPPVSLGPKVGPAETRRREFEQLLRQLENKSTVGSADSDWRNFQRFLREQADPESANDSGRRADSVLPAELAGLNWGACLLNVIWGGAMKIPGRTLVMWAVIMLLPVVGVIFPFYLLFKGNEWAWQHRRWASFDEFCAAQKKWTTIGWVVVAGIVVLVVGLVVWIMQAVGPLLRA